jgi:hypothetical protein
MVLQNRRFDSTVCRLSMKSAPEVHPTHRAEKWDVDAGSAGIAWLGIPADAARERIFEIAISLTVRARADAIAPWHELRVLADGERQWSRRIPTQHPADFDGLDFRFRRRIAAGHGLRLEAHADCHQARRLHLVIEATEV